MKLTISCPTAASAEPEARGSAKPALTANSPASAAPTLTNQRDFINGLIKALTKGFIIGFMIGLC
jgi:hypothetical protein